MVNGHQTASYNGPLKTCSFKYPCMVDFIEKARIECLQSRGQHLCNFIGTKESVFMKKEFKTPTGLVWDTNIAAISLFWNTNLVTMTSCKNTLFKFGLIILKFCKREVVHTANQNCK